MGNGGSSSNARADQDAAQSQSRAGRFRSDGGRYLQQGRKPVDVVRLMGENVNNLSLYDETRGWKIPKIKEINKRYQTDGLLLQECGTDFRQVLRVEHLRDCIHRAKKQGNMKAVVWTRQILRNEKLRRHWSGVHKSTKPRRGGAPTSIKVQLPTGDVQYDTREDIVEQAGRRLTDRFQLARDAPICNGALFDEFGYLGDILQVQGQFSRAHMIIHLKWMSIHACYARNSTPQEISNYVSSEDFQYFWQHADEFIQSSYSHIHFGHCKAIAHDRYLSSLEASKLSLAATTGIPMDRWGSALTVLLEKEFGNIYLEKMRAICLLEADFNWLNKLIFAERMMDQAYDNGLVPVEQFA
eukprot:scaffold65021_cov87-Cyclotella_meneghiniana.AAC.11